MTYTTLTTANEHVIAYYEYKARMAKAAGNWKGCQKFIRLATALMDD